MAMTKTAAASGANTLLACANAAATSTAAMIPIAVFSPKLTPFWVPSTFQQPEIVSYLTPRQERDTARQA